MGISGSGLRRALVLAALVLPALGAATRAEASAGAASLGISTQRLTDNWRERNGYWAAGLMVVNVRAGSRAAEGGIISGDVLVSVDQHMLREPTDLVEAELGIPSDRAVPVILAREGGHSIKMFDLEPVETAAPQADAAPQAEAAPEAAAGAVALGVTNAPDGSGAGNAAGAGNAPSANNSPSTANSPAAGNSTSAGNSIEVVTAAGAAADDSAAKSASTKTAAEVLGVRCQDLTDDLAGALGATGEHGVLLLEVTKESAADHAGLRSGDVIFKLGDQAVPDVESLDKAIATVTNPVSISILRRGQQSMVLTTLEGHDAASPQVSVTPAADGVASVTQEQMLAQLQEEVRALRKELAELRSQLAKWMQESEPEHQ